MGRRSFLAAVGGISAASTLVAPFASAAPAARMRPNLGKKQVPLVVQPALTYVIHERRDMTSWRPWGGIHTEADASREMQRIDAELAELKKQAEFPLDIRPVARARNAQEAAPLRDGDADLMLVFGASGEIEPLIKEDRYNMVFVRHNPGPVYLWYEIAHPRLLRKTVDVYGQPGLAPEDVVVDSYDEVLWRLRSLSALQNTVGSRIVAIGAPSGWGHGGQKAPEIAANTWKLDMRTVPYDDLGKRIESANKEPERVARCEAAAADYLKHSGIKLQTATEFVSRAFLLTEVFEDLMEEHDAPAMTINECMSTIMPMSQTTACLCLTLINDSGAMAFCESDFVVIPSGILLKNIAGTPVFLNDPTYPHDGQITLAHCTAPRRMNGKKLEPAKIMTHFESDYGAAPMVKMDIGHEVTVLDPDFGNQRWIGFKGKILDNPELDICRSQVDVSIEGDWRLLAQEMRGFHWMMSYGDHLKETGYALRKMGVGWLNLTTERTIEA
jgi:hypothetical protein